MIESDGKYYPLKDITSTDKIDKNNIKYVGAGNTYSKENCSLPPEFYSIEKNTLREYKTTYDASYVLIENINYDNNVKIYHDNKIINFSIISTEDNKVKINLNKPYLSDTLLFYIDSDEEYTITLYMDLSFNKEIVSKKITNEKISIPDSTWITENTQFRTIITYGKIDETSITKLKSETTTCSYKEKYVYKYEVKREYYDDNYYSNIEGYIKDINDYKIYYKGKPIVNAVEIIKEKTVEIPQIEYIYTENKMQENDSSQKTECQETKTAEKIIETKTEIVEKKISEIPKKVYVIISVLSMIIILLIIKLYRKYVE